MSITDYDKICAQLRALTDGVNNNITNLANAAALLWYGIPNINWVGFYLYDGSALTLGPFQGKPACVRLQLNKGVCAAAARSGKTVKVDNVHLFEGHIACDSASNSEIVVPVFDALGKLYGVMDIDSPTFARFTDCDVVGLERFAKELGSALLVGSNGKNCTQRPI